MMTFPRTWTAKVEVRRGNTVALVDAKPSEYDLLHDQTVAAVREAEVMLTDDAVCVHVVLYKTTKARGTEKDRTYHVFRDRRGQVRYQ
jgi:siroheme synthase